jgi:hypothetical protein
MNKKAVIIKGNDPEILSVDFLDILNCIENKESLKWSVLYLKGILIPDANEKINDVEDGINNSKNGKLFTYKELINFSNKIYQKIEFLVIGDKIERNLKRYLNDTEMKEKCNCTIELIDSSYFLVYAETNSINNIKAKILGIEDIN